MRPHFHGGELPGALRDIPSSCLATNTTQATPICMPLIFLQQGGDLHKANVRDLPGAAGGGVRRPGAKGLG